MPTLNEAVAGVRERVAADWANVQAQLEVLRTASADKDRIIDEMSQLDHQQVAEIEVLKAERDDLNAQIAAAVSELNAIDPDAAFPAPTPGGDVEPTPEPTPAPEPTGPDTNPNPTPPPAPGEDIPVGTGTTPTSPPPPPEPEPTEPAPEPEPEPEP
jgi:hypothetical protein